MSAPVEVCVVRRVRPGRETAFEEALHAFVQRSLDLPGQLGVHVIRPAPGSGRDYGILRRFASAADRDAFYASPLFTAWEAEVAPLTDGPPRLQELTGLETWFTVPGEPHAPPPPPWKMAFVTWIGVNLATTPLVLWMLPPLAARLAFPWHHLLFNAAVVVLLTWLIMPALARAFAAWLQPSATVQPASRPSPFS
jgi:antibiotic biosynthesis monooxygenase (ABM) superfamily enzyme